MKRFVCYWRSLRWILGGKGTLDGHQWGPLKVWVCRTAPPAMPPIEWRECRYCGTVIFR